MACFRPLRGWRPAERHPRGADGKVDLTKKNPIAFRIGDGYKDRPIDIPCGQCIGCRLERARMWALRCVHEASLYDDNCFVTLTYDEEHYPAQGSLQPDDMVKFLKRLRFANEDRTIRFFQCGEYGEKLERPHHHVLFFNYRPPDLCRIGSSELFSSEELRRLWPYGNNAVGEVSFESAAYVASYVVKKVTGPPAAEHYAGRHPEYVTMSRRPGVGREWFEKFALTDVYRHGTMVLRGGKAVKVPRYYDDVFGVKDPDGLERVKKLRRAAVRARHVDGSRLVQLADVAEYRQKQLERERVIG